MSILQVNPIWKSSGPRQVLICAPGHQLGLRCGSRGRGGTPGDLAAIYEDTRVSWDLNGNSPEKIIEVVCFFFTIYIVDKCWFDDLNHQTMWI